MDELTTRILILIATAILGTFSHWVKKSLRDGLPGGPIDYLVANPRSTFAMAAGTISACAAVIIVPGFDIFAMTYQTIAALGWTTGWTADSALNKGPGE